MKLEQYQKVKLKGGGRMVPVEITLEKERIFFKFSFNKPLMADIKMMEGSRWHGHDEYNPRKVWSVKLSERNIFQIQYLIHPGEDDPQNPYRIYDRPLLDAKPSRDCLRAHQVEMFRHGFTRHYCEIAAEMGTGKTLAAVEIIEASGATDWFYVAPKSALVSVRIEFDKWRAKVRPQFMTYEGLKKVLAEWPSGKDAPHGVVFDESSRIKNPTAQRTIASKHLAEQVRLRWGHEGRAILMSGSPAPKSPADWWSQCEVAQPGFLKEGTLDKFKNTLAIIEQRESFAGGGAYPHLVGWRDDAKKCNVCGLPAEAETHSDAVDVFQQTQYCHKYEPSVNEVERLYRRLRGMVLVIFKKDCLDLPDKIYREVVLKPTRSVLNAALAIQAKATSAISALTLLRELSDGFQYVESVQGTQDCPLCKGSRTVGEPYDLNDPDAAIDQQEIEEGFRIVVRDDGSFERGASLKLGIREVGCGHCGGVGTIDRMLREAKQVPTPKEDAFKEILDEHDEVGRLVAYAGFTGSIDRVAAIGKSEKWDVIRVDGRGWFTTMPYKKPEDMVKAFQDKGRKHPRILFDGHPGAAGMGLTLTESPSICYWSNDFNGESRIQSEDRIHRMGMNVNRGATIIDLLHLPVDRLILTSTKTKRRLQDMTMGEIRLVNEQALLTAEDTHAR